MLVFSEVELEEIAIHQVGNKLQEEGYTLSKEPLPLRDDAIKDLLLKYFLSPFKGSESYNLHHPSELSLHEVFTYSARIFDEPETFFDQSVNLAMHLYENSMHHKVKGGELYVAFFRNCIVDGELTDALGLFKSETKETFLKVNPSGDNFEIDSEAGININKLDKGCLIFNTERESGFRVAIVDATNKQEAQYWKDDFLQLKPRQDNYLHTKNYLNLCKSFATEQMPKEFEATRADEIDLL
ncbi:MAG: nucleoid-associated protein, partial [Chitinophagaceae bacterium]